VAGGISWAKLWALATPTPRLRTVKAARIMLFIEVLHL
jgi:hypothetical protein